MPPGIVLRRVIHIRPGLHAPSIRTPPCVSGSLRWCQDSARQVHHWGEVASRLSATEDQNNGTSESFYLMQVSKPQ
jgi:hypothetical protein